MPRGLLKSVSLLAPASIVFLTGCVTEQRMVRDASAQSAVAQTMKRQVTNAVDAGDGDYVARSLRDRLVAEPDNLAVRIELAEHYQRVGYPELAIEHYRLVAARFPANANVAIRLAKSLRDYNRRDAAIDTLTTFCKANPAAPSELLSLLGILRDDAGQFAEAEKAHRSALALAPKTAYLHNNLGYNLLLQGRAKEAAVEFREALAIEPHSRLANDNLGLALLAEWKNDEQPKEALLRWEAVGGPATAHNNLATVLMEQGRYAEARKELEIALSYQKDHPAALANLQLIAERDGKPATVSKDSGHSFWKRFTQSVGKAFTTKNKDTEASSDSGNAAGKSAETKPEGQDNKKGQ